MYTVTVQVFNCFGEVETEHHFHGNSHAACVTRTNTWCKSGWGSTWKEMFTVNKRVVNCMWVVWELR